MRLAMFRIILRKLIENTKEELVTKQVAKPISLNWAKRCIFWNQNFEDISNQTRHIAHLVFEIGLLQLVITWRETRHTGEPIAHWDI